MSEKSTSDELVLKLLDKVEAKKKKLGNVNGRNGLQIVHLLFRTQIK